MLKELCVKKKKKQGQLLTILWACIGTRCHDHMRIHGKMGISIHIMVDGLMKGWKKKSFKLQSCYLWFRLQSKKKKETSKWADTTVVVIIVVLLSYRILDNGLDMQRGRASVLRIGRRIEAGRQFDSGLGEI